MFASHGKLSYGPGIRAVVSVDPGIIEYYRSLIPKYYCVNRQRYDGHITVVRTGKEKPSLLSTWGKHEGKIIQFEYDPCIQQQGVYWYLNVYSEQIGDIREELGLPRFRFADRPCYHLSLANNKD